VSRSTEELLRDALTHFDPAIGYAHAGALDQRPLMRSGCGWRQGSRFSHDSNHLFGRTCSVRTGPSCGACATELLTDTSSCTKERSGRPWNATFPRSLGHYAAHSPSIETYRIPPCWGSKGRRTRCPLGGFPRRNSLWLNGARDPPAHEPAARNLRWRFASRGLRVRVPLAPPKVSYGNTRHRKMWGVPVRLPCLRSSLERWWQTAPRGAGAAARPR